MSETHKLRIKIGDAEFEAEGSEASVKVQYEAFLAALAMKHATSVTMEKPAEGSIATSGETDSDQERDLIAKAFNASEDLVSLKYLPKGDAKEADALLLLLFGYSRLRSAESVLGTQLLRAARQSGLSIERVDRYIGKHDAYLLKGGARKGLKYSLNNQGVMKSKELLKQLLV